MSSPKNELQSVPQTEQTNPQSSRATLRNFSKLLTSGQFIEIIKVLRRRLINTYRFFRKKAITFLNNHPLIIETQLKRRLHKSLQRTYAFNQGSFDDKTLSIALCLDAGLTHPKSSAFIRLISPLTTGEASHRVRLQVFPNDTVKMPESIDICIVQRSAFSDHSKAKELVHHLEARKIPLIFDTDDAFSLIDPTHPEYQVHTERTHTIEYLVEHANQVWVSTGRLQKMYLKKNSKTVVVDNSLDARLWRAPAPQANTEEPLQLVYMGTATHNADFAFVFPALEKLATQYPGSFTLSVIGVGNMLPERLWIKRLYQPRFGSVYPQFVQWFLQQGPFDVGLSPLVDSDFNRCKSDIKCLDYLAAGLLPVVSDLEPYQTPDLSNFIVKVTNNPQAWGQKLEDLIKDPSSTRKQRKQIISRVQYYLWEQRSAKQKSKQLLELISDLHKKSSSI